MAKNFKIGVDYHGVITADPVFFAAFNREALACGCKIYVLSGGHKEDIRSYLQVHDIPYSMIWSIVDYFDRKGMVQYLEDGSFKVNDKLWNQAKARYCEENMIDFHIDDSMLYGEYFTTPFCLFHPETKECMLLGQSSAVVNFNHSPRDVLQNVVSLIIGLQA